MLKKLGLLACLLLTIFAAHSTPLLVDKIYRANAQITVTDGINDYKVGKRSKFVVEGVTDTHYIVRFLNVYQYRSLVDSTIEAANPINSDKYYEFLDSKVLLGVNYLLNKNTEVASETLPVDSLVTQSSTGMTSGTLIVPFKYRLNDKSLSGDATVGLYAGYNVEFMIEAIDSVVSVTPFFSAGVSQISVATQNEEGTPDTENKTGVTVAAGFLIQNWDSVNIGIVWGQDRIGEQSWEYEGKSWFSISVGWEF